MISATDLASIRKLFARTTEAALPVGLCSDLAALLGISDITISIFSTSDCFMVCASSADGRLLDEWEFTFREGPAHASVNITYSVPDTAGGEPSQQARLSAKAHDMGYRSLASIPLHLDGQVFGTIRLHDRRATIGPHTLDDAEHIAIEIVPLILGALSRESPSIDDVVEHHEFHQATGMVMSQMGVVAPAAADLLRAYAWARDRPLVDVARDVVSRILDMRDTTPDND